MNQDLQAILDRLGKLETRMAEMERSPGVYRPPSLPVHRTGSDYESGQSPRPAKPPAQEPKFVPAPDPEAVARLERRRAESKERLRKLCSNQERNSLIADDVKNQTGNGLVVVLSEDADHCKVLCNTFRKNRSWLERRSVAVLTMDTDPKERDRIVGRVNAGKMDVLFTESSLLSSDAFDCHHIGVIFFGTPLKISSQLLDTFSRLLMPVSDQTATPWVVGHSDSNVEALAGSIRDRQRVFFKVRPNFRVSILKGAD